MHSLGACNAGVSFVAAGLVCPPCSPFKWRARSLWSPNAERQADAWFAECALLGDGVVVVALRFPTHAQHAACFQINLRRSVGSTWYRGTRATDGLRPESGADPVLGVEAARIVRADRHLVVTRDHR